jgi:WD40 repeat protein
MAAGPSRAARTGREGPHVASGVGSARRERCTDAVYGVAISPDGRRALSCGPDRTIRLWDVETGQELRRMLCPTAVAAVAFSPDGRRALSDGDPDRGGTLLPSLPIVLVAFVVTGRSPLPRTPPGLA